MLTESIAYQNEAAGITLRVTVVRIKNVNTVKL